MLKRLQGKGVKKRAHVSIIKDYQKILRTAITAVMSESQHGGKGASVLSPTSML